MNWPEGTARIILAETASTNAAAFEHAASAGAVPAWILAHRQTAGKGRRGREWAGAAGNFYASHVMTAPRDAGLVGFVAGLALIDALEALIDGEFRLKWPNDVLMGYGKLAGILLEADRGFLVTGIGVNLASAPVLDAPFPPVSLEGRLEPQALLDELAPAFAGKLAMLATAGFGRIREDWLARAAGLGREITARMGNTTLSGTFRDLDADGALVLETADGSVRVSAADVYFARG